MCMSSGGGGDGGAAAREAARQARINENTSLVNSTFDSTYNDDYYNNAANDYRDYYNPQLSDKYSEAMRSAKLGLAQNGTLSSSIGASSLGNIQKEYERQLADITSKSNSYKNEVRSGVESQRNNLLNQAQGGSSMDQGAVLAAAQAAGASQPTGLLGDIFGNLLSNISNAGRAYTLGNTIKTNNSIFSSGDRSSVVN